MTQQQEKNFQISGGPYKSTGETASTLPHQTPLVDFFEKKEGEHYGYLQRNGSTQDPERKASGTHRSIQKRTQKPDAGEFQRSNQCTHLDSPVLDTEWSCHSPVRGKQPTIPYTYCDNPVTPKTLWHDLLQDDHWPDSYSRGHATLHPYGTEIQPPLFLKECILHNISSGKTPFFHPHTPPGCISLHKNTETSNSEAVVSLFPWLTDVLESMASFYHHFFQKRPYIFFLGANMLNNIPYQDIKNINIGRFFEKIAIFQKNKNQKQPSDKVRRYGIYQPMMIFGGAC